MPQKKNPDFAELIRGKTGRVIGDLVAMLTMLKALPLAYNKDMQEDKENVFDAIDTLSMSLSAMTGMIATIQINADSMLKGAQGGYMAATDLADFLVDKSVPFRDAHEIVGKLVLFAEKEKKNLQELTLEELQAASPVFDKTAFDAVKIENVVAGRLSEGGTATKRVLEQLDLAAAALKADANQLETIRATVG